MTLWTGRGAGYDPTCSLDYPVLVLSRPQLFRRTAEDTYETSTSES